jgi:hypothetical protein
VGGHGSVLQFFGHLAACDQYRDHHCNVPNGVLIQNSQNRDAAAIQVKLDELIRVSKAQKSFIGLEHLSEEELEEIRRRCEEAAKGTIETGGTPAKGKKSTKIDRLDDGKIARKPARSSVR